MLMVDAVEPEAAEATAAEVLGNGIAVGRRRQTAVEGGVKAGPLRQLRRPAPTPGQALQGWRIVQWGQGNQFLEGLLSAREG